jgi:FHA domain-containing protein
MPIKVNISLSAGGRFKPVASHTFHDKLITIGRDKECTLTLEDTQKHVSRMHAEIEPDQERYWIKVVSKVNPIAVNGKKFSYGERVPVVAGDQVSVGLYKLEIMEAQVAPPRAKAPVAARPSAADDSEESTLPPVTKAPPPDPTPKRESPTARLGALASVPRAAPPKAEKEKDEEEATYVPPAMAAAPAPSPAPSATPAVRTPLPDSAIADDEVTYIPPMWAKLASRTTSLGPSAGGQDASEDLTHVGRPPAKAAETAPPVAASSESSVGLDFDLSDAFDEPPAARPAPPSPPAPAARAAAPIVQPPPPASEVEEGFSDDVTYVRRPPPKPAPAAAPLPKPPTASPKGPTAEDLAEEETQYRPVVQPSRSPAPAAKAAPATGTDAERAVAAFLEGAGLTNLQVTDAERFMRDSGVMVRAAVEGVMMLLLAREEARRQMGADPGAGADDNPIKTMSNPDEVIAFLFDPKRPVIADVDPVQAFSDACSDLRAHQIALFEGMRAAIMTALLRLDPKKLEREHGSGLGMLNITRKSKLWDLSTAQHEQLAREIEDDFAKVFGAEILAAYNVQVRKTRGG